MKLLDLFHQPLYEVNMSPGRLLAFSKSPQAQGILVGFETELIVPMKGGLDDVEEFGPDYSRDQPCKNIDQIVNFFSNGDNPLSRAEANDLHRKLHEDWEDWVGQQVYFKYRNVVKDRIWDAAKADRLSDSQVQEILNNPNGDEYQYYASQIEIDLFYELGSEETQKSWFKEKNLLTMRKIEQSYNIQWPYWKIEEPDRTTVYDIAKTIENSLGIKINASDLSDIGSREPGIWVLEPDGSIRVPDKNNYGGLELITPSPPFPIDESLSWIDKVFDWARNYGCLTNASTGFHINVSLPEQTTEHIDWIKLVLFLGDNYVLEQFSRQANKFTKSALDLMKKHIDDHPHFPTQLALGAMRLGLMQIAGRIVSKPALDKYTSVNVKKEFIEFRSAGDNYLENQEKIKLTLLRYVRAMVIASDPQAEEKEYAAKLYKLLNPTTDSKMSNVIDLFTKYSSGIIDKHSLKSMLRSIRY